MPFGLSHLLEIEEPHFYLFIANAIYNFIVDAWRKTKDCGD